LFQLSLPEKTTKAMVEVFKTDVQDPMQADWLLEQIHQNAGDYRANFDLEDCDRILRVKCPTGSVQSSLVIALLKDLGCRAEVLPD
jgi:hypothetical protein